MSKLYRIASISSKITNKSKSYRLAMPVPMPSGETAQKMKEQGLYILQNMMNRMPHTTQKDMYETIKGIIDSGASELFNTMTPKTVISLPKIYILDSNDVFEVDGKQYVSLSVEPPRKVGKKWVSPSGREYAKNEDFHGEVVALDLDSGLPIVLPLSTIADKITKPTTNINDVLQKANEEISKYNNWVSRIGKAVGVSKLVLQMERAKQLVNNRINTLEQMVEALGNQLNLYQGSPKEAFELWITNLSEDVRSGRLSIKDAYDTILYINMSTPEKLVTEIESGALTLPNEIKDGVLAIARKEAQGKIAEQEKKRVEEQERDERIKQQDVPEIYDTEIQPFNIEDIPGAKQEYKEVSTPKTLWSHIASIKASIDGSNRDMQELIKIRDSIVNIEKYIGELEKGQRSDLFLNSPEGKPILDALNAFLQESTMFIKRYATNIIQDNKVNPKLMGTSGTQGNSLVAVTLTRLYNVVKETINKHTGKPDPKPIIEQEPEKQPAETPMPTPEKISIDKANRINKMSKMLWKAFENRMNLK